jgi:diguanylate cyclase (GGDEF)-like protein
MLRTLTPTEVAFVMLALMQATLTVVWLIGAWAAAETRAATLRWAAYAGFSAASFALLTVALRSPQADEVEWIRAAGNICGVLAMFALQQGVWAFLALPGRPRQHAAAFGLVLVAAAIGLDPRLGWVRVSVNSAVLTWICLTMGHELAAHARRSLQMRWPWLLALPLLLAAAGFAQRGLRALADPDSVGTQMAHDSALNIGSAFSYVPIALAFHAVLLTLVVARLLAELRWRSRHDGLTGLLNRRSMEELLAAQLQRSRRSAEPFAVLMLDMDHFKAINDRLGHAVGDLALKHAATELAAALRKVDRLGRFGGEEFVALLPGITLAEAQAVAERLRAQIAALPLAHPGGSVVLSVSIGLAAWQGEDEDLSRLLVRADQALYRAKQGGRDRVESDDGQTEVVFGLA